MSLRALAAALAAPLAAALSAAACAIPAAPPAPEAIAAPALREEGQLALADPVRAAFCTSQALPLSLVLLVRDGASVRPAAGADYALTLLQAGEDRVAWRLLVGPGLPDPGATALRLRQALAGCLGGPGRSST
jgi:hypothetical protein